jgi:hypothetical protein
MFFSPPFPAGCEGKLLQGATAAVCAGEWYANLLQNVETVSFLSTFIPYFSKFLMRTTGLKFIGSPGLLAWVNTVIDHLNGETFAFYSCHSEVKLSPLMHLSLLRQRDC